MAHDDDSEQQRLWQVWEVVHQKSMTHPNSFWGVILVMFDAVVAAAAGTGVSTFI